MIGAGKGAIDFTSGIDLKKIIEETDVLGYPKYSTTTIEDDEEIEEPFDYCDFDLRVNALYLGLMLISQKKNMKI